MICGLLIYVSVALGPLGEAVAGPCAGGGPTPLASAPSGEDALPWPGPRPVTVDGVPWPGPRPIRLVFEDGRGFAAAASEILAAATPADRSAASLLVAASVEKSEDPWTVRSDDGLIFTVRSDSTVEEPRSGDQSEDEDQKEEIAADQSDSSEGKPKKSTDPAQYLAQLLELGGELEGGVEVC
eukprot:1183593-Prorocentrum_minimum.AAC.2